MSLSNPPLTGDLLEVKFVCFCQGQLGLNVRHYKVTVSAGAGADLAEIADALATDAADYYKDCLSADADYKGVMVQSIYPTPKGAVVSDTSGNGSGNQASQVLPTQVSGIITMQTALAGRSGRGRVYVPFPGQGDAADDGTPSAAYVANLEDLGSFLATTQIIVGATGTSDLAPVLIQLGNPAVTRPITGRIARNKWATQRRRGSYGAPNTSPI